MLFYTIEICVTPGPRTFPEDVGSGSDQFRDPMTSNSLSGKSIHASTPSKPQNFMDSLRFPRRGRRTVIDSVGGRGVVIAQHLFGPAHEPEEIAVVDPSSTRLHKDAQRLLVGPTSRHVKFQYCYGLFPVAITSYK
ncbi:hypothetical protein J6590_080890 [Homalodisca vitripennis]|nr:hypothetical protein J6590_080890 [Homalodisca vitripennis]